MGSPTPSPSTWSPGATIEVTGSMPVTFADYGIDDPSFSGISVGDTASMELALIFTRT